jgi:cellulose synthase/poly-beta-1,6-N-acetylglucosamine synthase-like glycosyltransferase
MPYSHPVLEFLFLFSVVVIWGMIFFNLVLTWGGYAYRRRYFKGDLSPASDEELPAVSAMIPARNEALVIEKTVRALLAMDYPRDKFEVIVISDHSNDGTTGIVERLAREDSRVRCLSWPARDRGSGKPRALNEGLKLCRHPVIAIYDGDNNPRPESLRILCTALVRNPGLTAALGKFRCINKGRNILTRMVNVETLSFQWMIQAGRYFFSRFAVLPGTNYVIRKDHLEAVGGWDEKAITEDSELSVRLQMAGYHVQFVPNSATWEQEPETLKVWIKQRTRWVRGNNYVLGKFMKPALAFRNRHLTVEFLYMFVLYYLFLLSTVLSHGIFLLSALDVIKVDIPGPYTAVWLSAFALYLAEVMFVLSYEKEDGIGNLLVTAFMYFTYCQMWLYVVFKALFLDLARINVGVWDKTVRFKTDEAAAARAVAEDEAASAAAAAKLGAGGAGGTREASPAGPAHG